MRLRKILGIALVLAVLTAVAGGLSVLNAQDAVGGIHVGTVSPIWTMISRFVVVLVFGTFGLFSHARVSSTVLFS